MGEAVSTRAVQATPGTGDAAVTLGSRPLRGLWQIAGWSDFQSAAGPILQRLGLADLGNYRDVQRQDGVTAWRIAPDRVWIEGTDLPPHGADTLALLDLSHARQALVVSGPAARDLLSCVVSVDTRPASLAPGTFIQTGIHGVGVLIACTAMDRFDILVPTSWAAAVTETLSVNARALAPGSKPMP